MTAPATGETPAPVSGTRRQLDVLSRQLLAQRSGLEAIVLQAEDRPAIKATAHGLIDQLEAAFAVVGVLIAFADMGAALDSIDTPAEAVPGAPGVPNTFGAKRRAATAADSSPIPEGSKS